MVDLSPNLHADNYWSWGFYLPDDEFVLQCLTCEGRARQTNAPPKSWWGTHPIFAATPSYLVDELTFGLKVWDEACEAALREHKREFRAKILIGATRDAGLRLWRKSLIRYFRNFESLSGLERWVKLVLKGVELVTNPWLSYVVELIPPPMISYGEEGAYQERITDNDLLNWFTPLISGRGEARGLDLLSQERCPVLRFEDLENPKHYSTIRKLICRKESRYTFNAIWGFMCSGPYRPEQTQPDPVSNYYELRTHLQEALMWCARQAPTETEVFRMNGCGESKPSSAASPAALIQFDETAKEAVLDPGSDEHKFKGGKRWEFQPGQASFNGKTVEITGKPWELLKLLVKANGDCVHAKEMIEGISPDYNLSMETLRTHVSKLRSALRKAFDFSASIDPIPHSDTTQRKGWGLIKDLCEPEPKTNARF